MESIVIYCDGGNRNNGKPKSVGGWGAILTYKGKTKEMKGSQRNTTNNVQELTACIEALSAIKTRDIPVRVYVDSNYVLQGINNWIHDWIKNGWKKRDKKPVLNRDLWIKLHELNCSFDEITWHKVKGHSGDEWNERADQLANEAMDELESEIKYLN